MGRNRGRHVCAAGAVRRYGIGLPAGYVPSSIAVRRLFGRISVQTSSM